MIIEIDDSLDGKLRRKLLVLNSTIYALKNTKTKRKAAKFLGITIRALYNRILKFPELSSFREKFPVHLRNKDEIFLRNYYEKNVRYFDEKTRKLYESYFRNIHDSRASEANSKYNGQDTSEDA